MKKILLATVFISLAGASAAWADDDDRRCGNVPVEKWMSEQQIRERAQSLQLDVQKIKIDDGCYEVDARNRDGRRVEVKFNPETGTQVSVDGDDDDD